MRYLLDFKKWGIFEQESNVDDPKKKTFKAEIEKKIGVSLDQSASEFLEKEGFLSWSLYSNLIKKVLGNNMKQLVGKTLPVIKDTKGGEITKDFEIKPEDIIPTEKIKALYFGIGSVKTKRILYVFCKEQPVYKMSQLKKVYDEFGNSSDINTDKIKAEMGGKESGNFYPWHTGEGGDDRQLPEWDGKGNPPATRLKVEGYDYLIDLSKTDLESFPVYKLDEVTKKNMPYGTISSSILESIKKENENIQEGDMEGVKII